jgi:hypothetical protein
VDHPHHSSCRDLWSDALGRDLCDGMVMEDMVFGSWTGPVDEAEDEAE